MLVLSRKLQEEILIGDNVKITVLKVKGNTVRLGIEAPRSVRVVRGELTPIEEPMAEVTVVFDNQDIENSTDNAVNVVPFPGSDRVKMDSKPKGRGTKPQNTAGPSSISFKNRLPESLQHSRLQQIARELSSKNV